MMIDGIRALDALVTTGSIGAAAERLRLTQPAVTRRIQNLEALLGTTLLDRRTRPPRLSPVGRTAHRAARQVLDALQRFEASVADPEAPSGEFRIGIAQGVADMLPGTPFATLRERFPTLRLTIQAGWTPGLIAALEDGRLDAAAVMLPEGRTPPSAYAASRLAVQPIVAVASPELAISEPVALADLAGRAWVLNPEGCGYRAALEQRLRAGGAALDVAVEVYGPEIQFGLVAAGLGLGLAPALLVEDRHPEVRMLRIEDFDLRVEVWLLHPPTLGPFARAVDALAPSISEALGRAGAGDGASG